MPDHDHLPFHRPRRMTRAERKREVERLELLRQAREQAETAGTLTSDMAPVTGVPSGPVVPRTLSQAAGLTPTAPDSEAPSAATAAGRAQRSLAAARAAAATSAAAQTALPSPPARPAKRAPRPVGPYQPAHPTARYVAAMVGAALAVCFAIAAGPVLGHSTRWLVLAAALVVAGALGSYARTTAAFVTSRSILAGGVAAAILIGAMSWGVADTTVINGHVYLNSSKTARAYRLTREIEHDLYAMSALDKLLAYDQADAQLHFSEYGPAKAKLVALYAKYSAINPDTLPTEQFAPVIDLVKAAANFGALAMDDKSKLVVEDDAKLAADEQDHRATFASDILAAGPALVRVAMLYHIQITPSNERGPAE